MTAQSDVPAILRDMAHCPHGRWPHECLMRHLKPEIIMRTIVVLLLMTGVVHAQECPTGTTAELIELSNWTAKEDSYGARVEMFLSSNAAKDIRMIKGGVYFYDAFDDHIATLRLDPDQSIPAQSEFEQRGSYMVERLWKLHPEDVRANVCVEGVVFDDGSVQEFDE